MRDARAPAPWLFEGFRLDLARGCLLGPGGAEVPLRPKSFDALRHLVENPGRLVPRDELMQAVWPDVFVTDDSIIQYVAEVRRALGDAGQRLLRTVPKHGYILATEVTSAPSAPVTLAVPPAEAVPKLARPDAAEADLTPRRLQARRRLAAVLAADLAGYSRLLAEDEAATLAALRGMRAELLEPLIRAHGGRVFAVMGDGLLAEFPSSVLALRCALALQASVAERWAGRPEPERLAFRVGVHQGEVVEEGDGVMGDGVNIAVRLQTLAEPGGICISGRVQEDVAGKLKLALDAEDIGERALKNIPRPVRVFRVPGAGSPRTQTGDGEVPPCPPPALPDRETAQRLYRDGYEQAWRESGPEEWLIQRDLFRRAVTADPSFAPAWIQLVFTYTNMVGDERSPNPAEDLRAAEQAAERALALTPNDPWAHAALGSVLRIQPDRLEEALAAYQRALALDSGQHGARGMIGRLLILLGGTVQRLGGLERKRYDWTRCHRSDRLQNPPPSAIPQPATTRPVISFTFSSPQSLDSPASGGKANALQQPLRPSEALAAVVGPGPLPRSEVVSKVWDYIKAHNLQNPEDRREILADDTLRKVFGKDKVTMFEMNKHLAQHLA